jgi:hypothetical protein
MGRKQGGRVADLKVVLGLQAYKEPFLGFKFFKI